MDLPEIKNILDTHWNWHLPVQVEDIAANLGIQLGTLNPFQEEHRGLSGLAELGENGQRIVLFNPNDCENRRRFTIAHEIGHHEMNHLTDSRPRFRDNANQGSFNENSNVWEEREANNFAAQLLMPRVAIDFMTNQKGITQIDQLAREFHVSESAMYFRLKNLGLLSY
ncbi:ImmA/IrrE family metallo-endopeptidase [Vibrio chagasii]|uniref:ImmA/IrrE family metallo-endopeptidase n=1 Tax=Vibrio chagasii TaxID=170679 RepID=UPI003735379F